MARRMTALCKGFPVSKVPSAGGASKREPTNGDKSEMRISDGFHKSYRSHRSYERHPDSDFLACGLRRSRQAVPREIAGFAFGVVEGKFDGGEALIELFGFAGADDGRRDARLIEPPAHRDLHQALAACLEEVHELAHGLELGVLPVALAVEVAGGPEGKARAGRRRGALLIAAAQETAGERVVGDDPQTLIAAER